MDTLKIKIKKMNKQARGVTIYISKREREHIGVEKGSDVVVDTTIPYQLRIMSIDGWKKLYKGYEDELREP